MTRYYYHYFTSYRRRAYTRARDRNGPKKFKSFYSEPFLILLLSTIFRTIDLFFIIFFFQSFFWFARTFHVHKRGWNGWKFKTKKIENQTCFEPSVTVLIYTFSTRIGVRAFLSDFFCWSPRPLSSRLSADVVSVADENDRIYIVIRSLQTLTTASFVYEAPASLVDR